MQIFTQLNCTNVRVPFSLFPDHTLQASFVYFSGMVTWQELVPSNQSQGHAANAVLTRQGMLNHGAHQTSHTQVDPGVNQTSHTHVNPRPNQASRGDRGSQPVSHSQGNSKTNQTKGMPHHSQTRADQKSKSSATGGRQSIDKQSAKPKHQSTIQVTALFTIPTYTCT